MNLRILCPLLVLISSGAPTFLVGGGGGAGLAHTFFCLICFFAAVLTINDSVGARARFICTNGISLLEFHSMFGKSGPFFLEPWYKRQLQNWIEWWHITDISWMSSIFILECFHLYGWNYPRFLSRQNFFG